MCRELHHMWRGNKYLEVQEWEDFIMSNKMIILAIVMVVPKINHRDTKNISFYLFTLPLEKVLPSLAE